MSEQPAKRAPWLVALPIILFAGLAILFWRGLSGNPNEVPSALIGKPVPEFELPPITGSDIPTFDAAALKSGQVTVVNVWASWCVPCREEHPILAELSKRTDIKVYGINYKDDPENARRFLGTLGQPFAAIGADESGRVSVDWGVYGVPETYVVDGRGNIRHKWIGPLTAEAITGPFAAEIEKAKQTSGN